MNPSPSPDDYPARRVFRTLWRRKLVCLGVAGLVVLGGDGYLLTRSTTYQSVSSVALLPVATNANVLPNYPNLISSLIPTYVQLISSPVLLDQVASSLPFPVSADQLAKAVYGQSLSSAAVIQIVATNPNPVRAEQIAAATTTAFLAKVQGNGVVIAQVYARPTVPTKPAGPSKKLVEKLVVVLAVIIGLAAGLAWDRLFGAPDRASDADDPARPPVLGVVPRLDDGPSECDDGAAIGADPITEALQGTWRSLRTNFMYAVAAQPTRTVAVIGLDSWQGNALVAANLAASVAELGLTVVLVDAALRRPALHEIFDLDNARGLTSVIRDAAGPASLLRPVPTCPGLQVITAGPPLRRRRDEIRLYRRQLPSLSSLGDLVMVSGPAVHGDTNADLVASLTDAVVLVAQSGVLAPERLRDAVIFLEPARVPILGTVLAGGDGFQEGTVVRDSDGGHVAEDAPTAAGR